MHSDVKWIDAALELMRAMREIPSEEPDDQYRLRIALQDGLRWIRDNFDRDDAAHKSISNAMKTSICCVKPNADFVNAINHEIVTLLSIRTTLNDADSLRAYYRSTHGTHPSSR